MMFRLILLISIAIKFSLSDVQTQPEQIHLSLGGNHDLLTFDFLNLYYDLNKVNPTQMIVTWVTFDSTPNSIVEYGRIASQLTSSEDGFISLFEDGGSEHRVLYIHRVVLNDLIPGQTYCKAIHKRLQLDRIYKLP